MKIETEMNKTWKNLNNKERLCMFGDCNKKAINSHVLQKNGILNQISENDHLFQLVPANAFNFQKTGYVQIKRIGIKEAYSFKGFCQKHDSEVFKPIESKNKLDLYNPYHQALFSYRGLCQEIRKKEISLEFVKKGLLFFKTKRSSPVAEGFKAGIKDLTFFKNELEYAISKQDFRKFFFSTVELPKIDLCISSPLYVGKKGNPQNLEEREENYQYPLATSFINIFPLKNKSYFIGGFHKEYPCTWIENKLKKLSYSKSKAINKELSDLVVLLLEFWAMSPKLYNSIPKDLIRKYLQTFSKNVYNNSFEMKTKINLFEKA